MNALRKEGIDVRYAAAFGSSDRLRPILTTSLTTVIGLLPLIYVYCYDDYRVIPQLNHINLVLSS